MRVIFTTVGPLSPACASSGRWFFRGVLWYTAEYMTTSATLKKPNVMLVDDDDFLLDMYAVKFKERGATITAFNKPQLALNALRDGATPDLLITDVVMPEMGGFEFLEAVHALKLKSMPHIIVLSNQGQDIDFDMAEKQGAAGYIIKANAIPSEVIEKCFQLYAKLES
jgi:two-component system, chemotaxis family, chemotaxis protein CheY